MAWSLNASDGPEATPSSAAGDVDLSSNFAARLGSVKNGVDSSVVIVAGVALTIAFGFGLVAVMRSK